MINEFEPYTPKFRILVTDISEYCSKSFLDQCGGAVYQVYVFNELSATYICSAQAMAECHDLGLVAASTPDDEEARELLDDALREANSDSNLVDYMDLNWCIRNSEPLDYKIEFCETREDVESELNAVLESCRGNAVAERYVDEYLAKQGK